MKTLQAHKGKDEKLKITLEEFLFAFHSGQDDAPVIKEILEDFSTSLLPGEGSTLKERINKVTKIIYSHGLDTQATLTDSVTERNKAGVMDFCRQLIEEYDCRSASEKALAQVAANAFMRLMEASHTFASGKDLSELGPIRNQYYEMMSKELDRANRHFISALTLLKQMKVPALNIKISTKNAYIAKNQLNIHDNENIEAK